MKQGEQTVNKDRRNKSVSQSEWVASAMNSRLKPQERCSKVKWCLPVPLFCVRDTWPAGSWFACNHSACDKALRCGCWSRYCMALSSVPLPINDSAGQLPWPVSSKDTDWDDWVWLDICFFREVFSWHHHELYLSFWGKSVGARHLILHTCLYTIIFMSIRQKACWGCLRDVNVLKSRNWYDLVMKSL